MPFPSGFDLAEASELLYLCDELYGRPNDSPQKPVKKPDPFNWALIFESPELGPLAEKWKLWQNNAMPSRPYALIIRGTAKEPGSVLEDFISFLMQATGNVSVGGVRIPYKFAVDPKASVHVGFALGTLLLLNSPKDGILARLGSLVPAGSNIYIAGHSQGAPVACLLRSYLQYGVGRPPNHYYSYKTYVFAQPKPGNDHYAMDFGSLFCNTGLAYRVTNSLDWVPQVPLTIEIPSDLNITIPLSLQTLAGGAILTTLNALQSQAGELIVAKVKADLQGIALALARTKDPAVANAPFNIPIDYSLNFVSAATEIALIGTPCTVPPATTCDFMFQHHASTYYQLMTNQLKFLIGPH
jgi:Lipase (class 3)